MPEQNALPLIWPSNYAPDQFIVAESNRHIWQAVQDPTTWKMPVLLVIGEAAGGKTHLAEIFRQATKAKAILTWQDIQEGDAGNQPYIIDNADLFFKSAPQATEALFHLVNRSITDKIPLLLTASKAPLEWGLTLPDLLSRLQAAMHMHLEQPSEEMVKSAYQKLFNDRGLLVDDRVLDYLALRSERSFAGIRQIVEHLDKLALEQSRKITIPLISNSGIFSSP